jgi:hypothetical protein
LDHERTLIRVVDFTIGPTASVEGSVTAKAGKNVSVSGSVSGSVYANGRIVGGIEVDSTPNHFTVDAVAGMVANAGYTAKGVVEVHIFRVIDIPLWTLFDFRDDVGGGDISNPPLQTIGRIWHH